MVPLRGLWNNAPPEGDKFISCEIDWTVSPPGNAVQFALSGNSPVALSQIVALVIDNGRCGADVTFLFPDTGFELTVAARAQGVYPVLTNALMFYALGATAIAGDVTILQVLNSMPPPVAILPSITQNHASTGSVSPVAGTVPVIAAGISGSLQSISLTLDLTAGAAAGILGVALNDGAAHGLWFTQVTVPASTTQNFIFNPTGLNTRFINGVNMVLTVTPVGAFSSGSVYCTAYFSQP